ncbi:MAG: SRPBCC domain-containing protein [Ignavibacteriaceae bacterium]
MPAIKHYLIVRSSPEKIYKALTTKEGVAGWWTTQTIIGNKINDKNILDFGERYHNEMRVSDLQINKKVEWLCGVGDKEWIGTKLIFEIEDRKTDCILRFSHANWKEESDFFASCNYHWGYYLRSLKLYCESGKGTPFTGE